MQAVIYDVFIQLSQSYSLGTLLELLLLDPRFSNPSVMSGKLAHRTTAKGAYNRLLLPGLSLIKTVASFL